MNTIDIILGIILIFGTVNGFLKGLFVEVTTLVGLVLGVYGAIHFSHFLGNFLKDYVTWDESMLQLVSFAGTFLIILITGLFINPVQADISSGGYVGLSYAKLGSEIQENKLSKLGLIKLTDKSIF